MRLGPTTFDCILLAEPFASGEVALVQAGLDHSLDALGYRHARVAIGCGRAGEPALPDAGGGRLLDPTLPHHARLAVLIAGTVPDPNLFRHFGITVERLLLCLTSPPLDSAASAAALRQVDRELAASLSAEILWTATSEAGRERLADTLPTLRLAGVVRPLLTDARRAGGRQHPGPARVGRHWRDESAADGDQLDALVAALDGVDDLPLSFMGPTDLLRRLWQERRRRGDSVAGWQAAELSPAALPGWLDGLAVFLAFGDAAEGDGLPLEALDAMAAGAVVIGPPSLGPALAGVVPKVSPEGLAGLARRLREEPAEWRRLQRSQALWLEQRHGPMANTALLAGLIGAPSKRPMLVTPGRLRRARHVLFVSGNGVGMGHLARQLAVARRLPAPLRPFFLSLSPAAGVVERLGFPVEYAPAHTLPTTPGGDTDLDHWNRWLELHLIELAAFTDAAAIVFDGNRPYRGLLSALARLPLVAAIWVRRGLWRAGTDAACLDDEAAFDLVVEPGDLASAYDRGPTQGRPCRKVAPVRLLDEADILPRDRARAVLGLDPDRPAALLQLGGRNNFDYDAIERLALAQLAQAGWAVVAADWLVREAEGAAIDGLRRLALFPIAQYHRAFDLAVAAAGYNGCHELLAAGIPAVFVPNEHPSMDDQLARARFAADRGLGLCVRAGEPYALTAALQRLVDPRAREHFRDRLAGLHQPNGAGEIARLVEAAAYGLRPLAERRPAALPAAG